MNLTQDIKRMLNALAYANAGDYLTPTQKAHVLSGTAAQTVPATPAVPAEAEASSGARPQVGLFLGSELSLDSMQYITQTCARLRHGLTVLTFLNESEAQELLTPFRPMLEAADIALRLVVVHGEPPAALASALRRRPEVAFLVCNEAGYFGQGLISGNKRGDGMPVPVVLVASHTDVAELGAPNEATPALRRTA